MSQPLVGVRDKNIPWYDNSLVLQDEARELLEKYSNIEPDKVKEHVLFMVCYLKD
jgi:hypothetical protein